MKYIALASMVLIIAFAVPAMPETVKAAYERIPAGKYGGPRQFMVDNARGTFGALNAWKFRIGSDESFSVRAFFGGEWHDLVLARAKKSPSLKWRGQMNDGVTVLATGGFFEPNIYVVDLLFMRGNDIVGRERYFMSQDTRQDAATK